MIKFEKIKPGMTLYDVRKSRWPSMNLYSTWSVHVKEVDPVKRMALVSWNGNPYSWVHDGEVTRYRANRPKESKK